MKRHRLALILPVLGACRGSSSPAIATASAGTTPDASPTLEAGTAPHASLPLAPVADVDLPGKPVRFDYADLDVAKGHLVIAHMNDASVVIAKSSDGSVVKVLSGIPMARGVVVADDAARIFVTSSPNKLVIIDNDSLAEIARVDTGAGPDGVSWDSMHRIVGVSDQHDGAISLIAGSGSGARKQVRLGSETGNVAFDATRAVFWITVVGAQPPDQLVAVDPVAAKVTSTIPLPGCASAHGLKLHPDGMSAFVACEGNSKIARVELGGVHALDIAPSGPGPDVLALDPGLGWLYVAAESGDLKVFDIAKPGLVAIDSEHPGDASHSVVVDPKSHRVFFPLRAGPHGTPVLRIMRPTGA